MAQRSMPQPAKEMPYVAFNHVAIRKRLPSRGEGWVRAAAEIHVDVAIREDVTDKPHICAQRAQLRILRPPDPRKGKKVEDT